MTPLWPFFLLLPPLAVTLFGGRTAWTWLSLSAGVLLATLLVQYVLFQFAQGNTTPPFAGLLVTDSVDLAYHDTYYVVANLWTLSTAMLPGLIVGSLLFLRAHPRRHPVDLALFWGAVLLFLGASYGISAVLGTGGMPRRYVEFEDGIQWASAATRIMNALALIVVVIAAARPILSWWRTRGEPPHAL